MGLLFDSENICRDNVSVRKINVAATDGRTLWRFGNGFFSCRKRHRSTANVLTNPFFVRDVNDWDIRRTFRLFSRKTLDHNTEQARSRFTRSALRFLVHGLWEIPRLWPRGRASSRSSHRRKRSVEISTKKTLKTVRMGFSGIRIARVSRLLAV